MTPAFSSPVMMGYLSRMWLRASFRSVRWSRVDGERYVPKRGVHYEPETI